VRVEDIVAYVDLAGLGIGDYTLPVRATVTGEAGVFGVDPAMVRVRVAK
jgi:hypothetical protein